MQAKLKDVAALAGVKPNTASTILNRRPNSWASKETEKRVLDAAKKLGYRPSRAALGIRLGIFRAVAFVVPGYLNPYYMMFAEHLERLFREVGYDLILEHDAANRESGNDVLESVLKRQVDGIICFMSDFASHRRFFKEAGALKKAVVGVSGEAKEDADFDMVSIDLFEGIRQAVHHLLDLGHRRIFYLHNVSTPQMLARFKKIERIVQEAKVPGVKVSIAHGDFGLAGMHEATRQYFEGLKPGQRPTALLAINDQAAIAAIRGLHDLGLRVPEDISVVGADRIDYADFMLPRLTTVEHPIAEVAAAVFEMVLRRLEPHKDLDAPPVKRAFSTRLVVQESTADPPAEAPVK
jgi:DNA-binding LacI/PurR family transcriptional regulator